MNATPDGPLPHEPYLQTADGADVYLRRVDAVQADAWRDFDRAAAETAKRYPGATPQDLDALLRIVMADAMAGFAQLPKGDTDEDEPAEKKTASTPKHTQESRLLPRIASACLRGWLWLKRLQVSSAF